MTAPERRATFGLAGIFMLRMLGLFLILPVFSLYAEGLPGATPTLIGVALGVYGLTQATLQIPFGMASDRFGRKPVILLGLMIFAAGSVVAAESTSIEGVILGRALQGAGAIAAAVLAMLADLTREQQRTKAMALVGISIGFSFILSLILGPLLNNWLGVPGIFELTAMLAGGAVIILLVWIPTPVRRVRRESEQPLTTQFAVCLGRLDLMRLNFGIFSLHAVLMALFVVVPLVLVHQAGFAKQDHWQLYLPVMLLSIALMVPFMLLSDRKGALRPVFSGAVGMLLMAQGLVYWGHKSVWGLAAGLVVFFAAFNLLEATLPSLISKTAPAESKGTAIGIYNSFEFLGAFIGGTAGGWLYGRYDVGGVFGFTAVLLSFWFLVSLGTREPEHRANWTVRFTPLDEGHAESFAARLEAVRGVSEVVVVGEEGVAYLIVDPKTLDERELAAIQP